MEISARKCRKVYDALPLYPVTARPSVVAKRVGMEMSAFRSILVQASFMFPICEDEEGRLSRMDGVGWESLEGPSGTDCDGGLG